MKEFFAGVNNKFGKCIGCVVFTDVVKELRPPYKYLYISDNDRLTIVFGDNILYSFPDGGICSVHPVHYAGDTAKEIIAPTDFDAAIVFTRHGETEAMTMELHILPDCWLRLAELLKKQNPKLALYTECLFEITDGVADMTYKGDALAIPSSVCCFRPIDLLFDPEYIEVHEDNPCFRAEGDCLIDCESDELILGCSSSSIPSKGVSSIGAMAFRCLERLYNPCFVIPECVKYVGELAFGFSKELGNSELFFLGSPELEVGAFGTKTEAAESDNEIIRIMPEMLLRDAGSVTVYGHEDSSVEAYCARFGIPFKSIDDPRVHEKLITYSYFRDELEFLSEELKGSITFSKIFPNGED